MSLHLKLELRSAASALGHSTSHHPTSFCYDLPVCQALMNHGRRQQAKRDSSTGAWSCGIADRTCGG
jgi:hypothetical protein